MFSVNIRHIGTYRHQEHNTQTVPFQGVGLNVSGLRYFQTGDIELVDPGPCFTLTPAGSVIHFRYGPGRENWVIIVEGTFLRHSAKPGQVELFNKDAWIPVPLVVPAPAQRLPGWRIALGRMQELLKTPVRHNLLRVELGLAEMIRFIMDSQQTGPEPETPARNMKRLIDEDTDFRRSLEELSRDVGYSAYHLRELFGKEFGMSPREYRNQRRMAGAMDLISSTRLSVKEMSYELNYRHVSHFSASFKKAFGMSPARAIARFRTGIQGAPGPQSVGGAHSST